MTNEYGSIVIYPWQYYLLLYSYTSCTSERKRENEIEVTCYSKYYSEVTIGSVKIQHENRTELQNIKCDKIMCLISSQIQNYVVSFRDFALVSNIPFSSML